MKNRNARVYAAVRKIPKGRVATYGEIAEVVGLHGMPRQVGYALAALPPRSPVPWHRVINAKGEVSPRKVPGPEFDQRLRLELEGVKFDARGRTSLQAYGWLRSKPKTKSTRKAKRATKPKPFGT